MIAQLQIHEIRTIEPARLTATVRCLSGPAHLHTRFDRTDHGGALNAELTDITAYNRRLDSLDAGFTALITLVGDGLDAIHPGDTIHGDNPHPAS